MPTPHTKRFTQRPAKKRPTNIEILQDAWLVMKPFICFSIKAMKVIGYTMIFIVKNIPRPEDHKPQPKNGKVIKI
jgi:hypothetical protein